MGRLWTAWQNRAREDEFLEEEYEERGIQDMCAVCSRECKVLDAVNSRFVCFGFVPKEIDRDNVE